MMVRSFNPVWYFVNNVGIQMDDTYYFFVLQNTFPYLPATVYHDKQGQFPWSSPIQLLPNGTLPTDIFYDPGAVYRLEWRAGPTQADQLVYEVNDYVPDTDEITPSGDSAVASDNMITNPQFAFVDFYPEFTADEAGVYEIAPGWYIELIGEIPGTITITQEAVAGEENFPGNPPYVLNINASGWTEVNLFQVFNNVSGLWANTSINATLVGVSELFDVQISALYVPSSGTPYTIIDGAELNTAGYTTISGGITLPDSDNSDLPEDAFIKFVLVLPATGNVKLSNIQLVSGNSVLANDPSSIAYIQQPIERQLDHTFHWYANSLLQQSKENILTGWDFSLNPFQFGNTTVATISSQCAYFCDQTILYQNAASQIQAGQNTAANRRNLLIKAVASATDDRFCMIQYIDPKTIRPFWSYKVSCLVKLLLNTSHNTSIRFKMRLLYRRSLPSTLSATEPVLSWPNVDPAVDPTFSAGWTEIIPLNDPEYIIPAVTGTGVYNDYPAFAFNQFQLPDQLTDNDTVAVVLYTMDQMNSSSGTEDSISIQSVSMTRNDFAIDVSPLTYDETLRRCQYYYEKSYEDSIAPGTSTSTAIKFISPGQDVNNFRFLNFSFPFKTVKRVAPTITFYTPAGNINLIQCGLVVNNAFPAASGGSLHPNPSNLSGWTLNNNSTSSVYYGAPNSATAQINTVAVAQPVMLFHYVADGRMGL